MKILIAIFTFSLIAFAPQTKVEADTIIGQLTKNISRAKALRAQSDIRSLGSQLELFRAYNYMYPNTEEGLNALISNPNPEKYPHYESSLKRIPKDPWNNLYSYSEENSEYEIISWGPDGIKSDDDISSDDLE